jgi:ribonucleoside-diphosphate reductase alpha chain
MTTSAFGFVCLLGNINLTQFINKENTDIDYEKLSKYVKTSIRFLDNVNDVSNAPLPQYVKNIKEARRVGLGVMGWASLLYMLQIKYGSDEAASLKEKIMQTFCYSAVEQSIALAKEKGAFPLCDKEKVSNNEFWNIVNLPQKLRDDIKKYGLRNSALFSIQPTGNTGVLCNLVSGGLEPVFLHEYVRTMIVPTCPEHLRNKLPQYWKGEFYETEMFTFVKEGDEQILRGVDTDGTVYKIDKHRGLTKEVLCEDYAVHAMKLANTWNPKASWACTTESLSVDDHIREMQDFSKWLDSSCTKTVNLPNEYPFADFQDVYLKCYKTGVIKGFTTYRAGTMASVLAASTTSNQDSGTLPKDRPDILDAHVYNVKVKGERYLIVVGLHGESPFEVFGGKCPDDINVKDNKESKLIRYKYKNTSKYRLEVGSVDFNDFASNFTANEQTLFRMCSLILRKGTPLVELVVQLDKSNYEGIGSLTGAISRVLKRYVEAQTKYEGTCAACGSSNLVFAEGCLRCLDCDNSKCG